MSQLCQTCAVGYPLPSGKCDHCDAPASSELAPSEIAGPAKVVDAGATGSAPTSGPYAFITSKDMLRAADICAKAAHDPLNRGEIASILLGASRILANISLRPSVQNK